ncbi:MAG: hypothetical protein WGN25_07615 [Candidatus Electrothrix sp. GW3-4]|uniref:hypothetical protein n=1 Tax=Candidatus Electrothrix sp. GW3-4 TaxID=3126740 RepID=UPI0030CAE05B
MDTKWVRTITTIVAASIGFGGGVLGQYFATERAISIERLKNINSLRSKAYIDFFAAQAKLQQARQDGYSSYRDLIKGQSEQQGHIEDGQLAARLEKTLWEYEIETKEARMKLAAFAPTELVEELADYYRKYYPSRPCDPSWEDDVRAYLAMRQELLADIEPKNIKKEKMYSLMWGCQPTASKNEDASKSEEHMTSQ